MAPPIVVELPKQMNLFDPAFEVSLGFTVTNILLVSVQPFPSEIVRAYLVELAGFAKGLEPDIVLSEVDGDQL